MGHKLGNLLDTRSLGQYDKKLLNCTGIDTIKYHTLPEIQYGEETKSNDTSHPIGSRGQPFPSR